MPRARSTNGRAASVGGRAATDQCPTCCGPCNLYVRANPCTVWPGDPGGICASPGEPIYVCATHYLQIILYNGICYGAGDPVTYWRFTEVPGSLPLPAGALVVDSPDTSPRDCLDLRCGNPGGLWVRGYPCQGEPDNGCPPVFWCASDIPVCGYIRFACPGAVQVCYKFDPAFIFHDADLPPDAIRQAGRVEMFRDCCGCMTQCEKLPLIDYPCSPAQRCSYPIPGLPGQPDGVELRPCGCCCDPADTYEILSLSRRQTFFGLPSQDYLYQTLYGTSTWDPAQRVIRYQVLVHYGPAYHQTDFIQDRALRVDCAWQGLSIVEGPWELLGTDSTTPNSCVVTQRPGPGAPGSAVYVTGYGSRNECDAFGYSANYQLWVDVDGDGITDTRRMLAQDILLIVRHPVAGGPCVGRCSGGNAIRIGPPATGGGCRNCGKEKGL